VKLKGNIHETSYDDLKIILKVEVQ
jgi:hypothetical protein